MVLGCLPTFSSHVTPRRVGRSHEKGQPVLLRAARTLVHSMSAAHSVYASHENTQMTTELLGSRNNSGQLRTLDLLAASRYDVHSKKHLLPYSTGAVDTGVLSIQTNA